MKYIKYLILAIAAIVATNAGAQTAAEVEASVKKMNAATTPCNQGAEPFNKFIEKFNTDADFLASRLKITPEQKADYANFLKPGNMQAKAPYDIDGELFCQIWGELQRNKAYLDCGWADSYLVCTLEFVRQGEKWYLGKIVPGE